MGPEPQGMERIQGHNQEREEMELGKQLFGLWMDKTCEEPTKDTMNQDAWMGQKSQDELIEGQGLITDNFRTFQGQTESIKGGQMTLPGSLNRSKEFSYTLTRPKVDSQGLEDQETGAIS